jgi:hypothetical protein
VIGDQGGGWLHLIAVAARELSSGASWPYELLGVGYAPLGIASISDVHRRQYAVEAAVQCGEVGDTRIVRTPTTEEVASGSAH